MNSLPKDHKALLEFLRSHQAVPLTDGVIAEKRVDVFQGKALIELLMQESTRSKFASLDIKERRDAIEVLQTLLDAGAFIPVRGSGGRNYMPSMSRRWADESEYAWIFEGSVMYNLLIGLAIIAAVMVIFMYPLWPSSLKVVGWYFTMALASFVLFIIVLAIIRLVLFVITFFALKPGIWLFPNLFADCGFFESFVPLYSWNN